MSDTTNNTHALPVDRGVNKSPGMTLRDWFAGQVIAGICASPHYRDFAAAGDDVRKQTCTYTEAVSRHAYRVADDLLRARAETTD